MSSSSVGGHLDLAQLRAEMDAASAVLSEAFCWARRAGYPPGSPEWQAIELADACYRSARQCWRRAVRLVELGARLRPLVPAQRSAGDLGRPP